MSSKTQGYICDSVILSDLKSFAVKKHATLSLIAKVAIGRHHESPWLSQPIFSDHKTKGTVSLEDDAAELLRAAAAKFHAPISHVLGRLLEIYAVNKNISKKGVDTKNPRIQ